MAKFKLVSGPNSLEVDDGDDPETVESILGMFRDSMNIPQGAQAVVNGAPATGSTQVKNGDEVAFNKPTGSKG